MALPTLPEPTPMALSPGVSFSRINRFRSASVKQQEVLRQSETETQSAERLEYLRKHQEVLRQSETEAQSSERLNTSVNNRRFSDKVRLRLNQLSA